nr:MAG TPA: hypothetical protein [Caudoviricetes sp.]
METPLTFGLITTLIIITVCADNASIILKYFVYHS